MGEFYIIHFERSKSVKLLTEYHLEFLSLKGCCIGSPESTFVKMPHCWKSHVMAQLYIRNRGDNIPRISIRNHCQLNPVLSNHQ